ncbi:MAM domain-containing glycosylphosphatidylinositol anchor protein 1 [Harpegnathos saltator]|uniref:MAM domain-containing glycosylphosphatidylinositol anchor protein 1 n=1 Tax=Harpegnathos saltator TaxID=610380 RepID=E2BH35_HARSA|nr:MAM domain-containing glycosylphosphatidylinositol anchor protein 1 [Harpegnathos saltator]
MNAHLSFLVRCPPVHLKNGKVRIRARGRIMRYDCFEGYLLVGNKYTSCMHGNWDTPVPVCVSTKCTPPPRPPHMFMVSKARGGILMFFCEPGYSLIGSAEIYCDGRNWNSSVPSCQDSNIPPPTKCDFEDRDLCMWQPDPHHDFDWKRHNFATSSAIISTGPTHDHTLGPGNDGHYLFTEASGQLVNDTARIISPLYNSSLTESGCFSFWYHMYGGITIGRLNVYFKYETNNTWLLMFNKEGDQGNQWLQGIFNLPKSNVSFQIIIEGVRGLTYISDIAIDDVAILQGDECVVKNNITGVTVGDDDQVEVVNAQQTCKGKCVYSMTEAVHTTPKYGPESCYCTFDCIERSMCCPDYEEYCTAVFNLTEPVMSTLYETKATTSASRQVTSRRPYNANGTSTTIHKSGFPKTPYYINTKDYIDPRTLSSSTSPTTRKVMTTTTPKRTTTRSTKRTTTPFARRNQTGWKRMTSSEYIAWTTERTEAQDRSELHSEEQNPEKVKHDGRFDPLLVGIVSATVIVFSLTLIITIVIIRRRKTYKRGSGSALSEDSDVRFLTSDEILDFNLARPVEHEEL